MEQATARALAYEPDNGAIHSRLQNESASSGVSWPAVFAGGAVTAAIGLILLSLGAGLGLSSASVWSNAGTTASRIGYAAIVWMILLEVMSSSLGGYLAGRLRTKWTGIHSDEVYFRDTAHGFLTWAVALVVTAAFLASAGASMLGRPAGSERDASAGNAYFVDALLRSNNPSSDANTTSIRAEAALILANALRQGAVPSEDRSYLDQQLVARAGLNQNEADRRVSNVFANAQQAADSLRKATAYSLLWTFVSLLAGAFCASFAATIGGKQRDRVASL